MNFMTPPIYEVTNIDIWKVKMSMCLKTLGMHVYLATIKKTYFGNDKYIEANAQALDALKHSLSKEYLFIYVFSLCFHFYSVKYMKIQRLEAELPVKGSELLLVIPLK